MASGRQSTQPTQPERENAATQPTQPRRGAAAQTFLVLSAWQSGGTFEAWRRQVTARLAERGPAGSTLDELRVLAVDSANIGADAALTDEALTRDGHDQAEQLHDLLSRIAEHGSKAHALTLEAAQILKGGAA